jgi:two-component sensor histidine kinase
VSDPAKDPKAEARHRLANVFQLLTTLGRMRGRNAADPETRRQINWLVETMGALAVLQQTLLSPGGEDFAAFLAEMAPQWRRRCTGRPITVELTAEVTPTHEQQASALAVIVNEWVANALAHAYPDGRQGVVRIALVRLSEDRAAISVDDDGDGYDPAAVGAATLGFGLVNGLAEHIRGTLSIGHGGGVKCRLEFPVIPAPSA